MAPDGRRIPAAEIERLVADRVCRFLSNGAEIFAAMAGGGSTILIRSPFDAVGYPYLRTWSPTRAACAVRGREESAPYPSFGRRPGSSLVKVSAPATSRPVDCN